MFINDIFYSEQKYTARVNVRICFSCEDYECKRKLKLTNNKKRKKKEYKKLRNT